MNISTKLKPCFLIAGILLLASCSSSKKVDYATYNQKFEKTKSTKYMAKESLRSINKVPKFKSTSHHMAPGFLFSLYHVSDDKLRGNYRANTNGLLKLPYGVRLNVKGKTFKELKNEVLKSYSKFFQKGVRNVSFSIKSRSYYVEIGGMVKKPGRYLVLKKDTLDKVIAQAGGLTTDIQQYLLTVAMKQKNQSYSISLNQYYENHLFERVFVWTGQDSLFIKKQTESESSQSLPVVTIMSGVRNPGKSIYQEGESIFYYLNKSGGTHESLAYQESYVLRETSTGLKKIQFNLTQMETIPAIQPNDIIMLNSEKSSELDKTLSRTAQISSILSTIALLILAL